MVHPPPDHGPAGGRAPRSRDGTDRRAHRALPPRTPYEDAVIGILREVLDLESVEVDDHLLALSAPAAVPRVIAQMRRTLGVEVPVADYVESQTVAGLSGLVARGALRARSAVQPPPLRRRAPDATPVLSFDQQRLWMENQLLPGSIYNVHGRRRIRGPLDVEVLRSSIRAIVTRHETLRTCFPASDEAPVQSVVSPERASLLRERDVADAGSPAAVEAAARALLDEDLTEPFDLEHGPLLRCVLIRLADDHHLLGVTMHHIVSDAWSVGLFVRELTALYRAGGDVERAGLGSLEVQYRDYATWQRDWLRGEALESRLRFWREHLRGAPTALALPTVQRRTPDLRAEAGQVAEELTAAETAAVHALCRDLGVTVFMVLYAAFASLLARWSGQRDLVIGVPVAGRSSSRTDRLIGFFVNLLPMRVDLSDDPTFEVLLERVRDIAVGGYARSDAPMDEVVRDLQVVRDPCRTPLFEVVLNVVGSPEAEEVEELLIEPMDTPSLFSRYDLNLTAQESGGALRFTLDYPADRCDDPTGHALLRQLRALVAAGVADRHMRPSSLDLDPDPGPGIPASPPAPRPWESVATRAGEGDRVAVVDGSGEWSYAWLASAADEVARELAHRRVEPSASVGVVRRPTAGFVAALLGVEGAGCRPEVVETDDPALTGPLGLDVVLDAAPAGPSDPRTLDLGPVLPGRPGPRPADAPAAGPAPPSPGPVHWASARVGLHSADRTVVLTARPGHLSTAMAATFSAGAALVIPDRQFGSDVAALGRWLDEGPVTVACLDGAILRALTGSAPAGALSSLRLLLVDHTGDLLPRDAVEARRVAPAARFVALYDVTDDGPAALHVAPEDLDVASAPLRIPLGEPLVALEVRHRDGGQLAAVGELGSIWRDGSPTGDHGRRRPDGTLELAPATAEEAITDPIQATAALRDAPGVTDAVVLVHSDAEGGPHLVGYVAGPGAGDAQAILGQVAARLAGYLVPENLVVLDQLPRTAWGEYDLRALTRPERGSGEGGYAAPRSSVERRLTGIVEELLGIERVGIYDSFFELGGFSMLATRLLARIRDAFGVQLSVRDVFESPTVAELGGLVLQAQAARVDVDELEELLREIEQV